MIDLKLLQVNPQKVEKAAKDKGVIIDIQKIIKLEKEKSELGSSVQKLREERNKFAKEKDIEKGKKLKEELGEKERKLKELENGLSDELSKIPNLPKDDVKIGKDESGNEVVKKFK